MTLVKNTKIFDDFASFSIHSISQSKSKIEELGHYDPNSLKRYHDPRYQSGLGRTHSIYEDVYAGGTWTEYDWGKRYVIYDDHYLDGKPCIHLFFRHYPFGNGFVSKRITLGHWHHIYVVSCNDISILDCMRVHESKDIYFTGKLIKDMPIIDASEGHYLYVIEGETI